VSSQAEVFLGIIAVATLLTSIVQIGVLVAAGLLTRRVHRLVRQVEEDLKPIFGHLNAMAHDASRAAALATAQVERVDRAIGVMTTRLDHTLAAVQGVVTGPLKGAAWFNGLRTVLDFLRDLRADRPSRRADDEDALFI
jgi:hypothetical protein